MKPWDRIAGIDAAEFHRLHDEARQRAVAQREEAIGEFWRGAHGVLWAQLSSARRAAVRLAQRLQRHRQLRGSATG